MAACGEVISLLPHTFDSICLAPFIKLRRARELDTPVDWLLRAKHNHCLPDGEVDNL